MLQSIIAASYRKSAGTDPDADAYIAQVETHGTLTTTQKDAIDALFVGLKADGIYSEILMMYLFVGTNTDMMKYNAVDPQDTDGAFRITYTGTPTVSANGINFNGASSDDHGNTHFKPATHLTMPSAHMSFYSGTDTAETNEIDMGCANSSSARFDMESGFGSNFAVDICDLSTGRVGTTNTDSSGFYIGTRTSTSSLKAFKNGTQLGSTQTSTSNGTLPTVDFYVGVWNNNGSLAASLISSKDFRFVSVGHGLTDAQAVDLNTRVEAFNDALSRGVQA